MRFLGEIDYLEATHRRPGAFPGSRRYDYEGVAKEIRKRYFKAGDT